MRSSEYVAIARRQIREHADLFDALLEFERTKRMPRLSRKKRVNMTIDSSLYREVQREAKRRNIPVSSLVEKQLRLTLGAWRKEKA